MRTGLLGTLAIFLAGTGLALAQGKPEQLPPPSDTGKAAAPKADDGKASGPAVQLCQSLHQRNSGGFNRRSFTYF